MASSHLIFNPLFRGRVVGSTVPAGDPNLPLYPGHVYHVWLGDPEAFPGQEVTNELKGRRQPPSGGNPFCDLALLVIHGYRCEVRNRCTGFPQHKSGRIHFVGQLQSQMLKPLFPNVFCTLNPLGQNSPFWNLGPLSDVCIISYSGCAFRCLQSHSLMDSFSL